MNSLTVFVIFVLASLTLMFLSVPISISLVISSLILFIFWVDQPVWILIDKIIGGVDSYILLAIPFFFIAAEIMNHADITRRIMGVFNSLFGQIKGGLALINVFVNMFMAGISGSGIADASATGSVIIPEMKKKGYSGRFAAAITAASALCGPIIPPSIPLVIYGVVAQESIMDLFMAGYLPGLLIIITLVIYIMLVSKKKIVYTMMKTLYQTLPTKSGMGYGRLHYPYFCW